MAEGIRWLEPALAATPERTALRARALLDLSELVRFYEGLARARPLAEEALAISREVGDSAGQAEALAHLGLMAAKAGDLAALAASLPIAPGARFLHAAGRVRLSDLEAGFAAARLPLEVAEVYDTVPRVVSLAERALLRGEAGAVAGALLLSRGQARGLDALLREEGSSGEGLTFFCLSRAIALELSPQFGKNAIWADHPSLASLIETIKRWNGRLGR